MDEFKDNIPEEEAQQVVFVAPQLVQAAQQRLSRLEALRSAADSGDAAAILELGTYYLGEVGGTPRNAAEAFACFSRLSPDGPVS